MNQTIILDLIERFTGQKNILTIPRVLIDFTESLESALFLNQLLYWNNKKKGEWLFKTYQEWEKEISLSEYRVRRISTYLKKAGLIETKIKKARGNPTVHYRIKEEAFLDSILKFLKYRKQRNLSIENKETKVSKLEEFKKLNKDYKIESTIKIINEKILSKDNIDCKSNLDDNFSNSDFNKDSLTRKIKRSLSEPEDYSKEVQSLFEFWQSLKIVNHKKSKSRNKALQDLDKTLQKYSEKEIKRSMQVYKDFLNDPYNRKTKDPPYKVGLNQFFGFDKFTKDNIKNFHKDLQEMKSWFDLCLHNEETLQKKFTRKTKDKDPVLTKNLTKVIQQKNGQTKLTNDQLDMCRKASNRILDLWAKKYRNKKDFNLMAKKYIMSFYRGYILPWIENTANKNIEKNFGVHWLLSEHFEDSIEEFIKNPYKT